MTSQFLGIPLFKVYAFFVDGLLIDTGFANGRKKFMKLCDGLRPVGRGDQMGVITVGEICKRNLIHAFLKPKRG